MKRTALMCLAIIYFFFSTRFCLAEGNISDGPLNYVPTPDNAAQVGQALVYGKSVTLSDPPSGSSTTYEPIPAKALDGGLPDDVNSFDPIVTNYGIDVTKIRPAELGQNAVRQVGIDLAKIEH